MTVTPHVECGKPRTVQSTIRTPDHSLGRGLGRLLEVTCQHRPEKQSRNEGEVGLGGAGGMFQAEGAAQSKV